MSCLETDVIFLFSFSMVGEIKMAKSFFVGIWNDVPDTCILTSTLQRIKNI